MEKRGQILNYYGNGVHKGHYRVLDLTEENKKIITEKMGLKFEDKTHSLHIGDCDLHQLQGERLNKDIQLEEFFSFVDWSKYPKGIEHMSNKTIALKVRHYTKTEEPTYIKIKELGKMSGGRVSRQEYLIFQNGKYFFTEDPLYAHNELYTIDQFEDFLTACGYSDTIFLLDISTIKTVEDPRYRKLFRISKDLKEEQIRSSKCMEYVNGQIKFTNDMSSFKEKFPGEKIYNSGNEDNLYKRLGKYSPSEFEKGKTYVVREYEDLKAEYGSSDIGENINNKNKFPKENQRHSGTKFTIDTDKGSSYNIGENAIFPEETYEVNTMAMYTSATASGAKVKNIFTDEVIPEPPKVKISKVGERYFREDKTEIHDVSHLINGNENFEIIELQVNEKRFTAAMELGIEYDNLEEKSKRIQDIIKNELDSPEAIADKEWVYIYGASGSGKTTEAIRYFNDKGQDYIKQAGFGQLTGDDLLGYKSITEGTYFRSLLRDAVEYGKGYILDEADACNPNTLLVLNELKGEYMQFPDKKVKIHKDFRFIATGNTIGFSENYNGRSKMDRATTARFSMVEYNLTLLDIGERWGGSYTKRIKDIESKEPREIQREIRQMKQKEGKTNA